MIGRFLICHDLVPIAKQKLRDHPLAEVGQRGAKPAGQALPLRTSLSTYTHIQSSTCRGCQGNRALRKRFCVLASGSESYVGRHSSRRYSSSNSNNNNSNNNSCRSRNSRRCCCCCCCCCCCLFTGPLITVKKFLLFIQLNSAAQTFQQHQVHK